MGQIEMKKITLATGNKHKVEEINLISKPLGIEFILPFGEFDPVEDGNTFLENAYCKALYASKKGNTELYLADDSGLCVDSLGGEPGIRSARYAPTAVERIKKLLNTMRGKKERNAHFTCAMVVVNKKGEILYQIQKDCFGKIMTEPRGEGGFGYDPIFYVNSENKGMAELTAKRKSEISHRALALNCVINWLKDNS